MTNPAAELSKYKLTIPDTGAIVEFGCYDGSSMKTLVNNFPGREFWAFDTFEGMPSADKGYIPNLDNSNPPGKFNPKTNVESELNQLGVKTIRGVYCDTLPVQQEPKQIALAYLDCDWYTSYYDALAWLETKLVPKAVVLFDDYYLAGCRKAVNEWKEKHKLKLYNERYLIWGDLIETKSIQNSNIPIIVNQKLPKKTVQYRCGHCRPRF